MNDVLKNAVRFVTYLAILYIIPIEWNHLIFRFKILKIVWHFRGLQIWIKKIKINKFSAVQNFIQFLSTDYKMIRAQLKYGNVLWDPLYLSNWNLQWKTSPRDLCFGTKHSHTVSPKNVIYCLNCNRCRTRSDRIKKMHLRVSIARYNMCVFARCSAHIGSTRPITNTLHLCYQFQCLNMNESSERKKKQQMINNKMHAALVVLRQS